MKSYIQTCAYTQVNTCKYSKNKCRYQHVFENQTLNFYASKNPKLMVFCEKQANNTNHKVKKAINSDRLMNANRRQCYKMQCFCKMSGSRTINDSQTF